MNRKNNFLSASRVFRSLPDLAKCCIFLLVLLWGITGIAQPNLVKAEYFFDTEPGFGQGIEITGISGPVLNNKSFSPDISLLLTGVHQLFVRVQDENGQWSITNRTFFYKPALPESGVPPHINKAEYFFDDDPGFGSGSDIPVSNGSIILNKTFDANIGSLSAGVHQMFIRVRDANGQWSITNRTFFYKPANPESGVAPDIVQAEYFFDNEPGFGSGTLISIANGVTLLDKTFSADISSLQIGVHQMFIRVKDANGHWSISNRTFFYKPALPESGGLPDIVQAEYFFDNEPGFGTGTPINITNGITILNKSFSADITSLTTGVHQMFIRVKDAYNQWSISNRTFFYKPSLPETGTSPDLVKAEYFIDTDPGFGKAIPYPIGSGNTITDAIVQLNVSGLPDGTHKLFIRVQDINGIWSITNTKEFTVSGAPPGPALVITSTDKTNLCANDVLHIGYQAVGTFNAGNQFIAELSDEAGNFATPANIGSVTATASGSILAVVPTGLPSGTGYLIRIRSTDPVFTGTIFAQGLHTGCANAINPVVTLNSSTNITCSGGSDGAIDINITGGNTPYTFAWTKTGDGFSANTEDLTGLYAGTYHVLVTEAGGGTGTLEVILTQPSLITLLATASKEESCGQVNGAATVQVTNGVSPLQYLWDNGETTATATTLSAGLHTVTVTDATGCSKFTTVTIGATANLSVSVIGANISCGGADDGSATAHVTGGTGPFSYLWNNGGTTSGITALSPGNYSVVVTDANGCTANGSTLLEAPAIIIATATKISDETCLGLNNGSASVAVSGGATPSITSYRYIKVSISSSWAIINSPSIGTVASISELKFRWNGISQTLTGYPITLLQGGISYGSFALMVDGIAETSNSLNIAASNVPFTFYVDLGVQRPVSRVEIAPQAGGIYNLPKDFTVSGSNDASTWQVLSTQNTSYLSGNGAGQWPVNGYYFVSVDGGSGNSNTYLWDNGETTATATALSAGLHSVTVTNSTGCDAIAQVTIGAGAAFPANTVTVTGSTALCQGQTVTLTADEGASWLWSNGATTQSIIVGTAGNFSVTVTNAAGCSATSSIIQVTVSPQPVWFIDNDQDGYGTGTTVSACNRPLHGFLAEELTSTTGDCDDNNPNINASKQYFQYSTTPAFATSVIDKDKGTSYTTFNFEVDYFDANNQLPLGGYPRLILDYEGNGIFTNANDRVLTMVEKDASDQTTSDGKRYVLSFVGLPYGSNYQTRIVVNDVNNCGAVFGPFNYPDVLQEPNIQIFANDIKFSKFRTDVGETIHVSADVTNTSDQPAQNFVVKLVSQYNPAEIFPIQTVGYLAPYGKTTVGWDITTPNIPAWVPMQVFIDETNVIDESNELDNTAVRPYVNGNYPVPGNIVTTSNFSPSVTNLCYSNTITIYGKAIYVNTAVALPDPSVAGATVTVTIAETGATYSGYTNSLGNYSISFPAPPPGTFHINGTTTDFTLEDPFNGSFQVIYTCPTACTLPELTVSAFNLSQNSILQGGSITGTVTVTNSGSTPTPVPTQLLLSLSGGIALPQSAFTIPVLAPGASHTVNITSITFPNPGYYSFYASADGLQQVAECAEWNNYRNASLEVRPNLPDIRPYGGPTQISVYNCPNPSTAFTVENIGGVAAGAFDIRVKVRLGANVVGTYLNTCPGIGFGSNRFYSFTVPHVYTQAGVYSYDIECDIETADNGVITELREDNNTASYENLLTVLACKPDLSVSGCTGNIVSPVNPVLAAPFTLTAQVTNGGNATAVAPFTVRFLYSNGTVYDVVVSNDLPAGQTVAVSTTNAIAPAAPGVGLTVIADITNTVAELSETNNQASGSLCHELQPVASCSGNTFSGSILLYNSATPWVAIRTNALYRAKDVKVKFEVSGPGISGTQHLGTVTLPSELNLCNCPTVVQLNTIFAFNQLGDFTFTYTVDPDNEFAECNEGNNVMQTVIHVYNNPDMRILSQFINPDKLNPAPGENVHFDITYENIGRSNVPDQMKLKVLVNGVFHDQVYPVGGLVTGDKATISIPTPWNSTLYGSHIIRAIIDADNQVVEGDELNNEATRAIIVGTAANLKYASFTTDNSSPAPGDIIHLNPVIENEGDQACTATCQFFLKDLKGQQVYIGEMPFSIGAKAQVPLSFEWIATLSGTTITTKIVNVSVLEFNTDDNEATLQLGDFAVAIVGSTQAPCPGGLGSLSALASGGTAPYVYEWSSLAVGEDLSARAGTYTVTVTDATGQSVTATGNISSVSDGIAPVTSNCPGNILSANAVVSWIPPTFTDNCGSVEVSSNYSPGATFPVGATTVTYTAVDESGNISTCSFDVTVQAGAFTAGITGDATVPCYGSRTATLTANPVGGRAPYRYLWTNGRTPGSIQVGAGSYSVTVTDADGLTATSADFTVTQPDKILADITLTYISCFGNSDGSISVAASGGTPGYTYSIDNGPYQIDPLFTNLAPGSYTINIKDANECIVGFRRTIREPAVLNASLIQMTPACFGQSTGSIAVSISGGTNPKTLLWTGPGGFTAAKANIYKLAAGDYSLLVTDANGCTITLNTTVTSYNAIVTNPAITPISCKYGTDGAYSINPSGGSGAGFTVIWSGVDGFTSTSMDIANLKAGNYRYILTDIGTGCQKRESISLTQPDAITLSLSATKISGCGEKGTITATGGVGMLPYQFSIDGSPFGAPSVFTGLNAGNHTVTMKDAKGCTLAKSINVVDDGKDAFESNNSRSRAAAIATGTGINARIGSPTDQDWFQFTTNATGGRYTLLFSHPSIAYSFELTDKYSIPVTPLSSGGTHKSYDLASLTTYYIHVSGTSSLDCYQLEMMEGSIPVMITYKPEAMPISPDLKAVAFPNPHQGSFMLEVESPVSGTANILLFDLMGRRVAERKENMKAGKNQVGFSNIKPMTYIYTVEIDGKQAIGKVIGLN